MILSLLAILVAAQEKSDYAVVVSKRTSTEWADVVQALKEKHSAAVIVYDAEVSEAKKGLADLAPRYACFVARPEEAGRAFVLAVHRLTRELNDDPYGDCLWGIVTGYDSGDALRIAKQKEPLRVRRVVAGCGVPLEIFREGAWYSEGEKNARWEKSKGGAPEKKTCPDDTTQAIADELRRGCDLFQTSGHATFRDWQIGYSYKNGMFVCKEGQLIGVDTQRRGFKIESSSPKLYSALGNCLMGLIPDREAMALAWMHTGGVTQMTGYVVSTWYGYGGWGVHDYFLTGRATYAESFYLNNQALVWQLESRFPKTARVRFEDFEIEKDPDLINKLARKHGLREKDEVGLLWDRDTVAFYGDPAWEARLDREGDPGFDQKLTEKSGVWVFEVTARAEGSWGRPPAMVLPTRVKNPTVVEGQGIVTRNFVLLPLTGKYAAGDSWRLRFRAGP